MEAVHVEKVTKRYGQVTAVSDLDLCVRRGALFGLLGPNGAGKTTTLRMLLRMLVPDEGKIRLFDKPLTDDSQNLVGYLPEERGLYPRMKVRDNLVFFAGIKGVPESEARRRAVSWLERLELGRWADHKVIDLSKGMQQKVQFITAVIHQPPLLILDEPFAGLDPVNATMVKDLMLELKNQGATVILSTHRMEQVEMMCESICLIHSGHKVLDGELKAIKKSYGKNTLRMEFDGDGSFLNFPELIEKVNHYGEVVEAKLRPGADPQEILKRAVESGIRVNRFELAEPPLNDIFIELVSKPDA